MKRHAALAFIPLSLLLVVLSLTTGAGFGQTAAHAAERAPSPQPSTLRVAPGKNAFADTTPGVITTVLGDKKCQRCLWGDGGPAADARVSGPRGVFVDASGNLFIAEALGLRIRRIDSATGTITTVAGNPHCFQERCDGFFSGDGGLATAAELNIPSSVVADAEGNLFISDMNNNRIRRVDKITGIITTVVGSFRGFSGDGGPARNAELNAPWGLAIDAAGNLFIADSGNARIRRVDALNGIITTVAGRGRGDSSGDGQPAIEAGLPQPYGLFLEASGSLLIASGNSIRRMDHATGIITTVAGGNGRGVGGDGGPAIRAQLYMPQGVAEDISGNIFIADTGNHRIRRVDHKTGIITTIAGNGEMGYGGGFKGDGGPAVDAQLSMPVSVAVDAPGNVFIADTNNHRIRRIQMAAASGDVAKRSRSERGSKLPAEIR
jgi:trimeric autotransporter adhesin